MAGGSGTRFWPKSTSKFPKQFLSFGEKGGKETLIVKTIKRFEKLVPSNQQLIVTRALLVPVMRSQVPENVIILGEPEGRNTAPCIYWAARELEKNNPDAVMLVMPADQFIPDVENFNKVVGAAIEWAKNNDDLVTLGVRPSRPETGFGYLKLGKKFNDNCYKVDKFVEKPNLENAQNFFESGNYLWNGGMFVWRVSVILKAFNEHMPEYQKAWDESKANVHAAYPQMTATSIDYGVMEKAQNVVSFPFGSGWDDLGSWTSLENLVDSLGGKHKAGVVTGGNVMSINSSGNIIDAPGFSVALLSANDLIIVVKDNVLMVADKNSAQDIKKLVDVVRKEEPGLV